VLLWLYLFNLAASLEHGRGFERQLLVQLHGLGLLSDFWTLLRRSRHVDCQYEMGRQGQLFLSVLLYFMLSSIVQHANGQGG